MNSDPIFFFWFSVLVGPINSVQNPEKTQTPADAIQTQT